MKQDFKVDSSSFCMLHFTYHLPLTGCLHLLFITLICHYYKFCRSYCEKIKHKHDLFVFFNIMYVFWGDELLLKFQQIWGLTDICFRSVSLQLTSAGACMEAPTTSRVMEVRIAQTQPTAPTAVASTPPPQPPAECPLSDSSSFLGTQVWLSAQFANSYRI